MFKTERAVNGKNAVELFFDNARKYKRAALLYVRGQSGRKAGKNVRRDVCKHYVGNYLAIAYKVGALYSSLAVNAVKLAVMRRAVRRHAVDIGKICALSTQKDGRYA